jgi:hypothetical protein
MATLAFDYTPASAASAADMPTPDALVQVAIAFLDAGLVQSSAQIFSLAANAGADPEMTTAGRQRALGISATDTAVADRVAGRSVIMLPSADRGDDGAPRFFIPLLAEVAGQPEVMQVINDELNGDGVDAELRNFLGAFLELNDVFIDCDPAFGFASLSAATSPDLSVRVIARAADHDHTTFLRHAFLTNGANAADVEGPNAGQPQSLGSLLSHRAALHASRIVIHAGTADDLGEMESELNAIMRDPRLAAVAWTIGSDDATREIAARFEAVGGSHFVVASDAKGVLLVPEGQVEGGSLIITIPAHALADRQAA